MKGRFKYRIYPTPGQKHQLAKVYRIQLNSYTNTASDEIITIPEEEFLL